MPSSCHPISPAPYDSHPHNGSAASYHLRRRNEYGAPLRSLAGIASAPFFYRPAGAWTRSCSGSGAWRPRLLTVAPLGLVFLIVIFGIRFRTPSYAKTLRFDPQFPIKNALNDRRSYSMGLPTFVIRTRTVSPCDSARIPLVPWVTPLAPIVIIFTPAACKRLPAPLTLNSMPIEFVPSCRPLLNVMFVEA
jgi:hypothetical protein